MALLVKQPNEIYSDMIRTVRAALVQQGVPNPQVSEGSDFSIICRALATEISIAMDNVVEQADQLLPDTATGEDLDRLLAMFGLTRRPPSQASGFVELESSLSTLVAQGTQLVSGNGLVYEVTVGGTYDNEDEIPVTSIDTGALANLSVGDVLSWITTPAFASSSAAASQAITGGIDAENDEAARARLLLRFQNPPALSNPQQVAELCESFDSVVQKAFVYPCANGPATIHVALQGYATDVSKSKEITSTKMEDIESAILGNLPEYVETTVTTVNDVTANVSLKLTIPYPSGAANLGQGGGWVNFAPWPLVTAANPFAYVVSASTSTSLVVKALAGRAPTAGITRISWIDKANDWTVKTAIVLTTSASVSGSGVENYTITIDSPFVGVAANDWIFPSSVNSQAYIDAALEHFNLMGPGEKTDEDAIESRAKRRPRPNISYPMSIDGQILRAVIDSGNEVLSCDFWARQVASVEIGEDAPDLVTAISDPPNIYIPGQLAVYPSSI